MAVKPPRPQGPHLNAMRAFEAAARLGGFAAAADELSVTPGAISQQIKALEAWTGAQLFERRSQGVVLTPLGRRMAGEFTHAFDALGTALHGLRAGAGRGRITIAALPSVAQLWLAPRLPALRAELTGQVLSVTALETPPNLKREMFDLSLFIGPPEAAPDAIVLCPDRIFPVCTPEIATRLGSPADLLSETLLADATWAEDWSLWLHAAGLSREGGGDRATFSLYSLAQDEALSGAGVLIAHEPLVAGPLADGRLVAPFGPRLPTGRALLLDRAPGTEGHAALDRLASCLSP